MMDVVVEAKALEPYILEVTFADGARKRINVESVLYGEVFEPLRDPSLFCQVAVDQELGTVVWPNGADLSPEFLRSAEAETVTAP